MARLLLILPILLLAAPRTTHAQSPADSAGVVRAALDYIEGFYEGDADKLRRSLRPELVKFGLDRERNATEYKPDHMTFEDAIAYADRVKARGGKGAPPNAPRDVRILDVLDQTAAVKVTAWWGTDYLQLAKYEGRWMIIHVLWQSPPPKP